VARSRTSLGSAPPAPALPLPMPPCPSYHSIGNTKKMLTLFECTLITELVVWYFDQCLTGGGGGARRKEDNKNINVLQSGRHTLQSTSKHAIMLRLRAPGFERPSEAVRLRLYLLFSRRPARCPVAVRVPRHVH